MHFEELKGWTKSQAVNLVRRFPALDSRLQILRREVLARGGAYPEWRRILGTSRAAWESATKETANGPRVLMATGTGSHLAAMQMETTLAAALTLRGAQVEVLLCDKLLPGCQMCEPRFFPDTAHFAKHGPRKDLCGHCYEPARSNYGELGLPIHAYSDGLSESDLRFAEETAKQVPLTEIEHFALDGLNLGEHAKAGALRFFARATIDGEPDAERVLRRYLEAAILTAMSVSAVLKRGSFDVAVFHHGIYVPQGIVGEVCRRQGVRVVNWNPAYRASCFIFSHEETYHHTLMDEPVSAWESMYWPPERDMAITEYLRSRWQGENDWIRFQEKPFFEKDRIFAEIGCDPDRPIIGCLTNVLWDAQLHYPGNAFADMLEWLLHTIRHFQQRPDVQLVIRVHPAEIGGSVPTRQPVADELKKAFSRLPPNVFLVPPESKISTYALAELCDSVIIYGTKTGVELTSFGIPVIVAGEAWIRNKGVTTDANSPAEYDRILDGLPVGARLPLDVVTRARKYAFHFFLRRMIPIRIFKKGPGLPPYVFDGALADLAVGQDAGLDCVCNGILEHAAFVFEGDEAEAVARNSQVFRTGG